MAKRTKESSPALAGETLHTARELLHLTSTDAVTAFRAASGEPKFAAAVQVTAGSSSITDELSAGAPAFGEFVQAVGLAVAYSQAALDETLVKTAEALSSQKIKVVSVFEQTLDNDGVPTAGQSHIEEFPLVNYLMPTAYKFENVFLTMDMNVSEFNSAQGFKIDTKSKSTSANIGGGFMGGWGFNANAGRSTNQNSVEGGSAYGQDYAGGKMHMEVTISPRNDVQTPKPFVVQRAPQLTLVVDRIVGLDASGAEVTTGTPVGRRGVIKAVLSKLDGTPNNGKSLTVTPSVPLLFKKVDKNGTLASNTDDDGELFIQVDRTSGFDANKPLPIEVRVGLGLVSQTVGFAL